MLTIATNTKIIFLNCLFRSNVKCEISNIIGINTNIIYLGIITGLDT